MEGTVAVIVFISVDLHCNRFLFRNPALPQMWVPKIVYGGGG